MTLIQSKLKLFVDIELFKIKLFQFPQVRRRLFSNSQSETKKEISNVFQPLSTSTLSAIFHLVLSPRNL